MKPVQMHHGSGEQAHKTLETHLLDRVAALDGTSAARAATTGGGSRKERGRRQSEQERHRNTGEHDCEAGERFERQGRWTLSGVRAGNDWRAETGVELDLYPRRSPLHTESEKLGVRDIGQQGRE